MQSTVPSRLRRRTGGLLCENSSFTRKYSEMMSRRRTRIKIKNFFINLEKEKAATQAAHPKKF
jgi:hypothetical protein